jgi:uncharacterized protein
MNRRAFIANTALAGLPVLAGQSNAAESSNPPRDGSPTKSRLIDTNVYLGQWPFRTLPDDLVSRLTERGVIEAWAGSFDAIFHRDLTRVNATLSAKCKGILKPVGSIHPKLPDWRDDLRRCVEQHGMKAIRLHPSHHGYTLDDPAFIELMEAVTAQKLLIQVVAQMEDERTQHPLVQVKPVDFKPLPALLKRLPEARVMVLNANRAMSMTALAGSNVWLDLAMLEGVGGVENLLKDWPLDRVVFGSYAPVFYWESAKLKLQESELSEQQLAAITHGNAASLM